MAFSLGIRHGFDLDHLATIDAMTRALRSHRDLSRMVGCLFSLGHGLVVTLISWVIGSGLMRSSVPEWLDSFGNGISILFLILFGLLNLWSLFQSSSRQVAYAGIKSYLFQKLAAHAQHPATILLIGALFAFSFDTFSQIALFSMSASLLAGSLFSAILGLTFMLGMMVSDGLNGICVATLIQRADGASLVISQSLGLAISLFSLALGALGLIKMLSVYT